MDAAGFGCYDDDLGELTDIPGDTARMRSLIEKAYFHLFSRKPFQKANDFVLHLATRARGYNNFRNHDESGERYFIAEVLSRSDPQVTFDVGANIGTYAQALLQSTHSAVYAFEPLARPWASLERLKAEFRERLFLVNKAVGAQDGITTIHYSDAASAHASLAEEIKQINYVTNEQSTVVEVITLDTFCQTSGIDRLDFVKIDTEGFEFEVLAGARDSIARLRPVFVQIEYNWHQLFRGHSLLSFSNTLPEYTAYQLLPNRIERREPTDPFANIYQFSDFVFVRRDRERDLIGR